MNSALESIIPSNVRLPTGAVMEYPGTAESPSIVYNREARELRVSGNSSLENAEDFYKSFVDQIYDDLHEKRSASVDFHLNVFGPKTAKVLFKFFENLKYFKLRNRVANVTWKYDVGDDSMRELGEAFSELFDLDFELKAVAR